MYPVIQISDTLFIPTYFLVIAIGYTVGMYWVLLRSRKYKLNAVFGLDLAFLIMIFGFLGSRLLHVFWELPEHYLKNPMDILKVWQGGFVFYGGALFAFVASSVWVKLSGESFYSWSTVYAPVVPLVYGIGRFATLLSGSGFGKPTTSIFGITYPPGTEAPFGVSLHPTPVYSMLWSFATVALLLYLEKTKFNVRAQMFLIMIAFYGVGRLWLEQLRGDFRGQIVMGLTISSWISLGLILVSLILILKSYRKHQYGR